ncbi:hypothetical protein GC093_00640 [Paenibacillus sp. LMG 31456]|uniref:Uncharacterized protein n=1 Tax=Paenibacillus foliorum TaxID=2654974 RepID=A0A972K0J1_9BACL|nr:hypothetical protein [Paenibacillus foliorum]NOU91747.1 hypothetical protein [Paenibacillus foliorum]
MEPTNDELLKGLADGPLTQHGFSDKLKKRIGANVEIQVDKQKKWMPWIGGICTSLVLAALFLTVDWQGSVSQDTAGVPGGETILREVPASTVLSNDNDIFRVHSAMLIGLRKDHLPAGDNPEYSTYRTLLLAEDQGKLSKVAEGDGILMPYKTDFTKITPQSQVSSNEEYRMLKSSLTSDVNKSMALTLKPAKPLRFSEKLLFAGNRYLSISQTSRQKQQGKEVQSEYVWVKDLQDLSQTKPQSALAPARDPHVSLSKLYADPVQSSWKTDNNIDTQVLDSTALSARPLIEDGESWAIVRNQGEWVPKLASYSSSVEQGVNQYQLREVPLKLPTSVVSYDRLTVEWKDILKVHPDAKDAFSSPNDEMVGVVSDREIVVYPLEGQLIPMPLLSVSLTPDESVVMIQWAVDEPFIEAWKKKGRQLLGK